MSVLKSIPQPLANALYEDRAREFARLLRAFRGGFAGSTKEDVVRTTYSVAYSVFAAHDVHEVGRKASATFFEILIGHIVARAIGISPRKKVRIPESPDEDPAYLPTDCLFDPGPRNRKIHLPIKTSTRERAVQAWVYQLVLERIFSAGQYRGVLVVASEPKRNSRTGEVIEICVPRQLQLFQGRLTEMSRVYFGPAESVSGTCERLSDTRQCQAVRRSQAPAKSTELACPALDLYA